MAPKRPRSQNLSVLRGMSLSLEERRALKGCVPATKVNGALAAAARPSLSSSSTVVGPPSLNLRVNRSLGGAVAAVTGYPPSASGTSSSTSTRTPPIPLRSDMPIVKNARRGGVASALSTGRSVGMQSLIDDLQQDREAASGKGVRSSHLATWSTFHFQALGEDRADADRTPVLPLTPDKVVAVAALFKAGDYRSYANYISSVKSFHLDAEYPWTEHLVHVSRWTTRSVLRGIGPARQSQPIPLPLVMALPTQVQPYVKDGPTHPREAYLLGSIFLLREVELSATRVDHLVFNKPDSTVTWTLSASKTDPQAFGVTRTLGCLCGHSALPCPFHLSLMVSMSTRQYASGSGLTAVDGGALPLFHVGTGNSPSKAAMVITFETLAQQCGLPLCSSDGARLFGGRSPRVAGAQALASSGAEVSKIKIVARHSGEAILRYVAEAPLASLQHELGRSATATKGFNDSAAFKNLQRQLKLLSAKFDEQQATIAALSTLQSEHRVIAFVQNLSTLAIHGQRAGDSSTTICGMKVGSARIKRGAVRFLNTIQGECWETLCEHCLLPERNAARVLEQASVDKLPNSAAKDLLVR